MVNLSLSGGGGCSLSATLLSGLKMCTATVVCFNYSLD